ncbi:MAG TPA: hypothetical protein VLT33_04180 [Labilithrix sp.]|nr:hypothetical protein [Labilithrix sp.]
MSARLLSTAALALGCLVMACNAPPPQAIAGTGGDALSDSDYRSLIADPATGQRDWIPAKPSASGIAYWHVGWVSRKGGDGLPVEYVLATGYDRLTKEQSVEVVIPQTDHALALQFRSLPGASPLDVERLTPDVEAISAALSNVLSRTPSGDDGSPPSTCGGRSSSYRAPGALRTLRRCRVGADATGDATGKPTGGDDIVVFLNILLDVAKEVQNLAHCEADVRSLDDDYRAPAPDAEWSDDCASAAGAGPGSPTDATGRTAGSACPVAGKVCFSSDGSKRGMCGADLRCWQ